MEATPSAEEQTSSAVKMLRAAQRAVKSIDLIALSIPRSVEIRDFLSTLSTTASDIGA
jgi:hypothetical protein